MNATKTPLTTAQLDALRPNAEIRAHYIAQGYASTEAEADRQCLLSECSDLYKEANGMRPRWIGDFTFEQLAEFYYDTVDQLKAQSDQLEADQKAQELAESNARTPVQFTIGDLLKI